MNKPPTSSKEFPLFNNHLIAIGKLDYAKGNRPNVNCIFCAVRDGNPQVTALKVFQDSQFMICLNLYPYNPGHLMVIPLKHIETFEDLTDEERNRLFELTINCQQMLRKLFSPSGFNVGYNEGHYSGASINHIHVHIVPRYHSELISSAQRKLLFNLHLKYIKKLKIV